MWRVHINGIEVYIQRMMGHEYENYAWVNSTLDICPRDYFSTFEEETKFPIDAIPEAIRREAIELEKSLQRERHESNSKTRV